jgi:hypothetical protein
MKLLYRILSFREEQPLSLSFRKQAEPVFLTGILCVILQHRECGEQVVRKLIEVSLHKIILIGHFLSHGVVKVGTLRLHLLSVTSQALTIKHNDSICMSEGIIMGIM